jgi:hypothetical protein
MYDKNELETTGAASKRYVASRVRLEVKKKQKDRHRLYDKPDLSDRACVNCSSVLLL